MKKLIKKITAVVTSVAIWKEIHDKGYGKVIQNGGGP